MDIVPTLIQQLQDEPEKVINSFEEIRKAGKFSCFASEHATDHTTVLNPSGMRFSVNGNVIDVKNPRSLWAKYFSDLVRSFHPPSPVV
jgi:hypothetical protein